MNVPGGQYKQIVMQNAATTTGNGTAIEVTDGSGGALITLAMQITGITTATVTFQATIDGSNWVAVLVTKLADGSDSTTATADGLYRLTCHGLRQVRAQISAYTSGTITVTGLACA